MREAIIALIYAALLYLFAVCIAGCTSPGKATASWTTTTSTTQHIDGASTTTTTTSYEATAEQPSDAVTPATAAAGPQGTAAGSGNQQEMSASEIAAEKMPWVGLCLMGLGIGTLVLRAWMPIVPLSASIVTIALGALAWIMPSIMTNMWIIIIGGGGIGALYLMGFFDNHRHRKNGNGNNHSNTETAS